VQTKANITLLDMPPKSRSRKAKQPAASRKSKAQVDEVTRSVVAEDADQTQGEPVAGGSLEETSEPAVPDEVTEEAVEPSTEPAIPEEVEEAVEPPAEPAGQAMTMEERADKLKALRLKMVSPVSEYRVSADVPIFG
jgi:hypothetical protein